MPQYTKQCKTYNSVKFETQNLQISNAILGWNENRNHQQRNVDKWQVWHLHDQIIEFRKENYKIINIYPSLILWSLQIEKRKKKKLALWSSYINL